MILELCYKDFTQNPIDTVIQNTLNSGNRRWYKIIKDNAKELKEAQFDLIWLPPPSFAGDLSAGYNPQEYFNFNNSYGSESLHKKMLKALNKNDIEPIADIVINHRDGKHQWADFHNPDWDISSITRSDECFTNPQSEVYQADELKRGAEEEYITEYELNEKQRTLQYHAFRDIDHTNPQVRQDIIKYLNMLKDIGYKGWRYDMVHGYNARWIAEYNHHTKPSFSVGEYDWDKHNEQKQWILHSVHPPKDFENASNIFDFSTFMTLQRNKANYDAYYGSGSGIGIVGDRSEDRAWRNKAVTFVENHDTGFAEGERPNDSFANNWEVEQAYAQILTHPGIPTVYWKHYFDWGHDLREKNQSFN